MSYEIKRLLFIGADLLLGAAAQHYFGLWAVVCCILVLYILDAIVRHAD